MGMMQKMMNFFGLSGEEPKQNDDEPVYDEYEYTEEWLEEGSANSSSSKVVSLQAVKQNAKMILVEPSTYDEVQDIADNLKNRKVVVMNLHRLHHDEAKRVVDFLSGTVYAMGGEIQKVGPDIFLCTPDNIQIQGSITDYIPEEFQSKMR